MAYADPQSTSNPTTGQPILAAWGDIVRDDLEYLARNRPHFRAYNSAALSIPNNAFTAVTLNSERFDVGGMHSTVSNTDRGTVPAGEAGKYSGWASGGYAAHATGVRINALVVNGATFIANVRAESATDTTPEFIVDSLLYSLAAADYMSYYAFQNSGGALNLSATGNHSPEFSMMWEAI